VLAVRAIGLGETIVQIEAAGAAELQLASTSNASSEDDGGDIE